MNKKLLTLIFGMFLILLVAPMVSAESEDECRTWYNPLTWFKDCPEEDVEEHSWDELTEYKYGSASSKDTDKLNINAYPSDTMQYEEEYEVSEYNNETGENETVTKTRKKNIDIIKISDWNLEEIDKGVYKINLDVQRSSLGDKLVGNIDYSDVADELNDEGYTFNGSNFTPEIVEELEGELNDLSFQVLKGDEIEEDRNIPKGIAKSPSQDTYSLTVVMKPDFSEDYKYASFKLGSHSTTVDLTDDLISYYELNETSGDVIDSHGDNDGTNNGATRGVSGKINDAFDFEYGKGDYVVSDDNIGITSNNPFTMSIWFKPESFDGDSTYGRIIETGEDDANKGIGLMYKRSSDSLYVYAHGGDGEYDTGEDLSTGNWQFLTLTYDGSTLRTYVDGSETSTSGVSTTLDITNNFLYISRKNYADNGFVDGTIDEVGIWNRALSSSEVSDLYNNGDGLAYDDYKRLFIDLLNPENNAKSSEDTINFSASVTNDKYSGIQNVSLVINENIVETNSSGVGGVYNWSKTLSDGDYNWTVIVYDNDSNLHEGNYRNFSIDTTSPELTIEDPKNITYNQIAEVPLNISASDDNLDTVTYNYNGTNETYTSPTNISVFHGSYTLDAWANDTSGNTNHSNVSFTVDNLDTTLNSPENGSVHYQPTITFNATGDTSSNNISNMSLYTNESGNFALRASDYSPIGDIIHDPDNFDNPENAFDGDKNTYAYSTKKEEVELGKTFYSKDIDDIRIKASLDSVYDVGGARGFIHLDTYNGSDWNREATLNDTNDYGDFVDYDDTYELDKTVEGVRIYFRHANYDGESYDYRVYLLEPEDFPETTSTTQTFSRNYTGGENIEWNVQTCDAGGGCTFADSNYTFQMDDEAPNISIENPNGTLEYGGTGNNETLNTTITDDTLEDCWYNYNGTNQTFSCSSGVKASEEFTLADLGAEQNLTVYANDSLGNIGSETTNWGYKAFKNNEDYPTSTTEGSQERFEINITFAEGYRLSKGNLIYNDTSYSANQESLGSGKYRIYKDFNIPGVNSDTDIPFYWNIKDDSDNIYNTSSKNVSVKNLQIDDCSSYNNRILNYTLKDESEREFIDPSENNTNTTIELDVDIYPKSDLENPIIEFSKKYEDTNPAEVCLKDDLNESEYWLYSKAVYKANGFSQERNNIQKSLLNENSTERNIDLLDLNESATTKFTITYKDSSFTKISGALLDITREYVGEGKFLTTEKPVTDSNGQATASLVAEDEVYTIYVYEEGELVATFDNIIPSCSNELTGECEISLNEFGAEFETEDWENLDGLTYYNLNYNETTKDIIFEFTTSTGETSKMNITADLYNRFENKTICSDDLESSSGTLTCNVDSEYTNSTVEINIYKDGEVITTKLLSLHPDTGEIFGESRVIFLIILMLMIPFMFITSLVGMIIGGILGLLIATILVFTTGATTLSIGVSLVWLIITAIILIWKINQGNS